MKKLKNKIAIITGGSRGMGQAYCERFCEEGAKVALVFFNHANAASEVVEDISKKGGEIKAFQCDVSNLEMVESTFNTILSKWKHLDVLFNNAGIGNLSNSIDNLSSKHAEVSWYI